MVCKYSKRVDVIDVGLYIEGESLYHEIITLLVFNTFACRSPKESPAGKLVIR